MWRRPRRGFRTEGTGGNLGRVRLVAIVTMVSVLAVACASDDPARDAGPTTVPPASAAAPTTATPPTTAATPPDTAAGGPAISVVSLNVLHGHPLGAPECADNDQCAAPDRIDLLAGHLEAAGCPEIVTLQEVDERIEELVTGALPEVCGGAYAPHLLADPAVSLGIDREMVLTTLPVHEETLLDLPAFPWSAHHVVLDSPLGDIDLVTTHLASGSNNPPCSDSDDCQPPCGDRDDARLCGARMILDHLQRHGGEGVWVVTGDLNAGPGEPARQLFLDAGFADAYLAAGNPECAPETAAGCTGGRSETDLDDPAATGTERIDYILVRNGADCAVPIDAGDAGGWADQPAEPVTTGGPVWVSDHNGVRATLRCG